MDDYSRLKTLLFHEEEERISHLKDVLTSLVEETNDPKKIVEKIVPLINDIFSETIQKDKEGFVTVFSPIINELLSTTIANSTSQIAESLAPVMGKAISKQIKNKRDEIIDALYPIMGNMISKFVTESFKEMMNELNAKVHSTFSVEVIKRKIFAKIKGVSEAELLLQSSNKSYSIVTVFLIHKETGILISERSANGESSIEPDMVASMLTAIRSFVNDWISQSNEYFELNEIEFGDSTIRLETAGSCYLATVIKGTINRVGQLKITNTFENLVEEYSHNISQFEGDVQSLPMDGINEKLDVLFEEEKVEKKNSLILWIILSLFIFSGSFFIYNSYIQNKVEEKARLSIYSDPALNLYALNVQVKGEKIIIEGRLPDVSLQNRLKNNLLKEFPKFLVEDRSVLTNAVPTHTQTFKLLDSMISILNFDKKNNIIFQFKNGIVSLEGYITNKETHKALNTKISKLNGVLRLVSVLKVRPSGETMTLFYESGKSALSNEHKLLLDIWIEDNQVLTLLEVYPKMDLLLIGYTDNKGTLVNNVKMSQKRAQDTLEYLVNKGIQRERLMAIGVPSVSMEINKTLINKRNMQIKWIKK